MQKLSSMVLWLHFGVYILKFESYTIGDFFSCTTCFLLLGILKDIFLHFFCVALANGVDLISQKVFFEKPVFEK